MAKSKPESTIDPPDWREVSREQQVAMEQAAMDPPQADAPDDPVVPVSGDDLVKSIQEFYAQEDRRDSG